MSGHGGKLDRKQEQAIAALLSEPTVAAAAKKARVAYSTLRGWLQLPELRGAYRSARGEVIERTVVGLLAACGEAVAALRGNLTCGEPAQSNRAAVAILDHAVKGVELLDLATELAELRKAVEEMKAQRQGRGGAPAWGSPPPPLAGGSPGRTPGASVSAASEGDPPAVPDVSRPEPLYG